MKKLKVLLTVLAYLSFQSVYGQSDFTDAIIDF